MADITEILAQIRREISQYNADTARLDARQIVMHACQLSAEDLILLRSRIVSDTEQDMIAKMVKRRLSGEPITKILGKREFWGRDFITNQDTLDPRPDSETLIDMICQTWQSRLQDKLRILDLGTGSGCLLLSLLSEFPNAVGVGVERSKGAAKTARNNATLLGLDTRTEILNQSWAGYNAAQKFDLIISNPPYIRTDIIQELSPEVKDYDPVTALDGGVDGLDCYRDLYHVIDQNLLPDGMVVFEIGFDQKETVSQIYTDEKFYVNAVWQDIGKQDRALQIYRHKNAFF